MSHLGGCENFPMMADQSQTETVKPMWLIQTRPSARINAGITSGKSIHEVTPSRYCSRWSKRIDASAEHCSAPIPTMVVPTNRASLSSMLRRESENAGYTPVAEAFSIAANPSLDGMTDL
jgi:hypothetical protein